MKVVVLSYNVRSSSFDFFDLENPIQKHYVFIICSSCDTLERGGKIKEYFARII